MITYEDYSDPGEEEALARLSELIRNMDNPDFKYLLNKVGQGFDLTSSVDIEQGMKTLFADYPFPREGPAKELSIIREHFAIISERMGYQVKIPQIPLVLEGDQFVNEGNYEKALEIFLEMKHLYPEGLMAYDRLGDVYYRTGRLEHSLRYYQMFLDKEPGDPRVKGIIEKINTELKK